MKEKFDKLGDEWEKGTCFYSAIWQMEAHPAFQSLVGMGKDIIPLAMERMKKPNCEGVFWHLILDKLVENPPDTRVEGVMPEMRKRWIEWWEMQK